MGMVNCWHCSAETSDMDGRCDMCGRSAFGGALGLKYRSAAEAAQARSRSRQPVEHAAERSHRERWAPVKPKGAPLVPMKQPELPLVRPDQTHDEAVVDAQALMKQAARDLEDAGAEMRGAWFTIKSEHMQERALGPAERHYYMILMGKIQRFDAVSAAYDKARLRLDQLLAIDEQLQRPGWGLPPGPGRPYDDPYADSRSDDGSIEWSQHRADRDRRNRIADQ